MAVPVSQMWAVASYVLKQRILRRKRYAPVLMLEPLLRCNLACAGCGKIQYPAHILKKEMEVEDALRAVEECGAPIISIPGGEPLMYSKIGELVKALVKRKKYIYLCTNALLLKQRLEEGVFTPSKYLTFNIHMDGDREAHDFAVCREGTYDKAEEAIKLAVSQGYRVCTNTTLFTHVNTENTRKFFSRMMELGVEGLTMSPGYSYEKAPDQQNFLSREKTFNLFRDLLKDPEPEWKFNQSPLFMEFLMGKLHLECTPWGNPCYTLFGWQKPCYLLQEGYADSWQELLNDTQWENYGRASGNSKCQNCMVHCGYEPTAVHQTFNSAKGFARTVAATLGGLNSRKGKNITPPLVGKRIETVSEVQAHAELTGKLQRALDYRGDVTVRLADGESMEGFVFNLTKEAVEFSPSKGDEVRVINVNTIVDVEFTGRDFADGRTWEAWVKKYNEAKAKREAGEEVGAIGIYSDPL